MFSPLDITNSLYKKATLFLRYSKNSNELQKILVDEGLISEDNTYIPNTLSLIKKDIIKRSIIQLLMNISIFIISIVAFAVTFITSHAGTINYLFGILITLICSISNMSVELGILRLKQKKSRKLFMLLYVSMSVIIASYMLYHNIRLNSSFFAYIPLLFLTSTLIYFILFFVRLEESIYDEDVLGFHLTSIKSTLERGFIILWSVHLFYIIFISVKSSVAALGFVFVFVFVISGVACLKYFIVLNRFKKF